MARNIPDAANQLCPGIGIHIIDIVHPPGISMPPDIDRQNQTVTIEDATKTSAAER
jgi:hypothetical protein